MCVCVQHIDIKADWSVHSKSATSVDNLSCEKKAHNEDYVRLHFCACLETRGDEASRLVLLYVQELCCGHEEKQ